MPIGLDTSPCLPRYCSSSVSFKSIMQKCIRVICLLGLGLVKFDCLWDKLGDLMFLPYSDNTSPSAQTE